MKLTKLSDVRAILAEHDIHPLKTLGQNFLIDANILGIILQTAALNAQDEILEIGAGLGILTEPLTRTAQRVVAVEKDARLCAVLRERLACCSNFHLIEADMLEVDHAALLRSGINKVVANLPYSVGSAILVNLLQCPNAPAQIVITLQQEVAERLAAQPGNRDFGLLSLWSQAHYHVEIRKTISPTCFFPPPRVNSAIIRFVRKASSGLPEAQRAFFYALTKHAFAQRRKQLQNILTDATITIHPTKPAKTAPLIYHLAPASIRTAFAALQLNPRCRPEELGVELWIQLAGHLI